MGGAVRGGHPEGTSPQDRRFWTTSLQDLVTLPRLCPQLRLRCSEQRCDEQARYGPASLAQAAALARLTAAASSLIELQPDKTVWHDWAAEVKSTRVSYEGEEVAQTIFRPQKAMPCTELVRPD